MTASSRLDFKTLCELRIARASVISGCSFSTTSTSFYRPLYRHCCKFRVQMFILRE